MDENKRGSFGSTIGFLLSAIGSAVGLGNIWGFPYKMGRCGGFTFLIVYLALAAFVGFHLFVAPQIARLSGAEPTPFAPFKARAAFSWQRRPGRAEVFPVRRTATDATGLPLLERLGNGVSATLFPLAQADGLAMVPAPSQGVAEGEVIDWQPFGAGV